MPSLALYYPRSKREIKLGLKALKDLGDIGYKDKGLKDLEDKNGK